jgi:hypothetical protein
MIIAASFILVALATYWFGFKEGFFSGVVHLACVVVAGALAFAFWEPLAHTLLGISAFREWAWGLSLLGLFTLLLLALRIATNLLIPDRQNYPHALDVAGGLVTGLCTGILTTGVGLIGVGFLPVGDLGGGYVRLQSKAGQPGVKSQVPFPATLTESFYASLSRGAFAPLTSKEGLATAYPQLARQAWGLQRDSADKGRVELAAAPGDLTVGTPYVGSFPGAAVGDYVVVPLSVNKEGFHRGATYVLSAAQTRLIGDGSTPAVSFPKGWYEGGKLYLFDGMTNYATNVPGEQSIDLMLVFDRTDLGSQNAKALLYKGLRVPLATASTDLADLPLGGSGARVAFDSNAPLIPGTYLRADPNLGVIINKNSLPAGMEVQNGAITESDGLDIPAKISGTVNKSLRVDRLYQLPGTKLVKLDVSRGKSPVDVWGDPRRQAGEDAELVLVDADGNTFTPVGWLWRQNSNGFINVKLDPRTGVATIGKAPMLSSAGKDNLDLLFSIPVGRTIVAVKLGDITIGTSDLVIQN